MDNPIFRAQGAVVDGTHHSARLHRNDKDWLFNKVAEATAGGDVCSSASALL
jgi:hypothetical protein